LIVSWVKMEICAVNHNFAGKSWARESSFQFGSRYC
jgi:hypothetical protein